MLMPNNIPEVKLRWYQTWYGLVLVGLVSLLVIVGLIFAVLVGRYYWLIRHGQSETLSEQFKNQNLATVDPALLALRKKLELTERPFLGKMNAPVTIVAFIDFKCPFAKEAEPILYQVAKEYSSKVKIIIRNFPLESIHPGSEKLSEVAYCAQQQGMFWQTYNYIFDDQDNFSDTITSEEISALAKNVGLDQAQLNTCLSDSNTVTAVRTDFSDGVYAGVKATPTFFINGEKTEGVIPLKIWEGFLKNFSANG